MESIEQPLARLSEAAKWFVVADELRVLHVITSGALRIAALETIAATEYLDRNKRPFVVLEIPPDGDACGWGALADELREDVTDLRDAFLAEDPASSLLDPLPPPITRERGIVRFGLELANALSTVRPPLEGLVIVFAPVRVGDVRAWHDALRAILRPLEISAARFVVVDLEADVSGPALVPLAARVDRVDARVDEAAARRDLDGMIDTMKSAQPGSSPARRVGLAAPKEVPPRRKNEPTPSSTEQLAVELASRGVPVAVADAGAMQELRLLVLLAAQAAGRRDFLTATEQQKRAAEVALRLGLAKQALQLDLMAAAYALQAGALKPANQSFVRTRDAAEAQGFGDLAAQAQMSIGTTLLLQKRRDEAIAAFAHAGVLGARLGSASLAIEGFRMAGQMLVEDRRLDESVAAFRRAIELAEGLSPEERIGTTAPEAARSLAALCRRHDMIAQAESLEAQARSLEEMPNAPKPLNEVASDVSET